MELFQAHKVIHFNANADLLDFLQCQDNQLISQTHFHFKLSNTMSQYSLSDLGPLVRTHKNIFSSQRKIDLFNKIITNIKLCYKVFYNLMPFNFVFFLLKKCQPHTENLM